MILQGWQVAALAVTAASADPFSPLRTDRRATVRAVAIARGESGWDTDAIGDTTLTDATWGPSVGLWQIRSLNARRGTGGLRDELKNRNPVENAADMVRISDYGRNWRPWSVWTSGAWERYEAEAEAAVAQLEERIGGRIPADIDDSFGLLPDLALGVDDSIVQPVAGAIDAVSNPLGSALAFLTDGSLWLRVGLAVAGFIVLVLGIVLVAGSSAPGPLASLARK